MDEMHDRLRSARISAGYPDASAAALALGVKASTYISHENGTRGFRPDSAEKYARRFQVSVAWLLYGTSPQNTEAANGFAESRVREIDMSEYKSLIEIDNNSGPISTFVVENGVEGSGILPGAIAVIDMNAKPDAGDYVLANLRDEQLAASYQIVGRLFGNYLSGGPHEPAQEITDAIQIRGKIIRVINQF
ncbi:MAG: helix-turn-helix transcriptional regulator [Pseudomonadota bacterium]